MTDLFVINCYTAVVMKTAAFTRHKLLVLIPTKVSLLPKAVSVPLQLQGTGQGMAEVTCSTYLGGERKESALALDLDSAGAIYLAGKTDSAAFPVTVGHVPLFGAPLPANWWIGDQPVVQYITDEAHFAFMGHAYYERRSLADGGTLQERSQSYACLRHLIDETAAPSGTTPPVVCRPPNLVRAAATQPTLQKTADLTGTISAGAVVTHTVTVDDNSRALFSLFWTTGTLQLELITPAGELITPTVALENHETITYTAPVTTTDFLQSAGYTIDNASAGEWQLRITCPQPAAGATGASHYVGFVSLDSPLALTVARDAQRYRPGVTATFTATIAPSSGVVTDSVAVTGTLYLPNGAIETVDYAPSVDGGYYQSQYTVPADAARDFEALIDNRIYLPVILR